MSDANREGILLWEKIRCYLTQAAASTTGDFSWPLPVSCSTGSPPETTPLIASDHPLLERVQHTLHQQLSAQKKALTLVLEEKKEQDKRLAQLHEELGLRLYSAQQELQRHQQNLERLSKTEEKMKAVGLCPMQTRQPVGFPHRYRGHAATCSSGCGGPPLIQGLFLDDPNCSVTGCGRPFSCDAEKKGSGGAP